MLEENSRLSLRYGAIAGLYYDHLSMNLPKQMELIEEWFPGLIIHVDDSDGNTKRPAEYIDKEYLIHAVKYHGSLYSGGSTRVSQILGRLTGSASGNQEKERKSAELIQRHVAEYFITDMTMTTGLLHNAEARMNLMNRQQVSEFYDILYDAVWTLAGSREAMEKYDRNNEPFSMYDETFDGVIYNAAYQLSLLTYQGIFTAYLWLLTGSLLRNETGRILRLYDSSFMAVNRQISETGKLTDKLNYLFFPERYYSTFDGDEKDLENRFPDILWTCDSCGARLNDQEGFDDHLPEWKCTRCGHINKIDISEIYDNEEDFRNRRNPVDPEKFTAAVEARKKELGKK